MSSSTPVPARPSSSPGSRLRPAAGLTVALPAFEGPLDLLLHLIRQNKVDICDIPIALIAQQYVDTLALMEALDINVAGEFLVMAATLMEIKSRLLLPAHPGLDPEGEEEAEDPRQELVERLVEYQKYKDAAEALKEMEANRRLCFGRGMPVEVEAPTPVPLLLPETAALGLLAALRRLLEEADEAPVSSLRRERITLQMKLREVRALLLQRAEGLEFRELFLHGGDREEVIMTFLALLELLRLGRIRVTQKHALGEIRVAWRRDQGRTGAEARAANDAGEPSAIEGDTV